MTGKHHMIVNCAAAASAVFVSSMGYVAVVGIHDWVSACLCVSFFVLGGLLPDIDSKQSMVGKHVYLPVRHRTITHAIWIPGLLLCVGLLVWKPLAWLACGWFLHMLCDTFSRAGVAWLWPITGYKRYDNGAFFARNHHIKLYASGSAMESVVVICFVLLFVFLAVLFFACMQVH